MHPAALCAILYYNMSRTNEDWAALIAKKIPEVLADQSTPSTAFSALTTPGDVFATGIDHTLLKPEATPTQIDKLCDEAIKHKFKACNLQL